MSLLFGLRLLAISQTGGGPTPPVDNLGALYLWGDNTYGQVGNSNTIQYYSWSQISGGGTHTLALRSDSTLWAWGSNANGQLGDNTTISKTSPVLISTVNFNKISAGENHSLAIDIDGQLWVWGSNAANQLGDGTTIDKSVPTIISFSNNSQISAGSLHSLLIKSNGRLYATGYNDSGQLGDNTTLRRSFFTQIGTSSWSVVSAGGQHSLAINSAGKLFAWGYNGLGQLGQNNKTTVSSPVQIGTSNYTAISAGSSFSLAIASTGALYSWGDNGYGQMGTNTNTSSLYWNFVGGRPPGDGSANASFAIRSDGRLAAMPGNNPYGELGINSAGSLGAFAYVGNSSWTFVDSGFNYTLAISSNKKLFAWGRNSYGNLGDSTTIDKSSPVQIGTGNWVKCKTGVTGSWGIAEDGTLWGWGYNIQGQIASKTMPSPLSWRSISAGVSHTLAIKSDYSLAAWGNGAQGALGNGASGAGVYESIPVTVGSSSWSMVLAGNEYSFGITIDGRLFAWGLNSDGVFGNNGTTVGIGSVATSPIQIPGTSSWSMLATTDTNSMYGLTSDKRLFTWGLNSVGQLGLNDTVNRSSPVQIGTSSWLTVGAGTFHAHAIRTDYALFAIGGLNSTYQLGLQDNINRSSPVQVGTSSWSMVTGGYSHTVALTPAKELYGWGSNQLNQLGPISTRNTSWKSMAASSSAVAFIGLRQDGKIFTWGNGNINGDNTITARASPIQLGNDSWVVVAAGGLTTANRAAAIKTDGTLWAWGNGVSGILGDGTTVSKSSPVQVAGGGSWSFVSVGVSHMHAIKADGTLWGWGLNTNGALGIGTTVPRSSPVQVGTSSWITLTSSPQSAQMTWAIRQDYTLWGWGFNSSGQLGQNNLINASSPVQITGGGSWSKISAGATHTMGIMTNSTMWGWGRNSEGQLGVGDIINRSAPVQIPGSWLAVSAGNQHTIGVKVDGTIWGWGNNGTIQLGDGTTIYKSSPVQLRSFPTLPVNNISTFFNNSVVVYNQGFMWHAGADASQYFQTGSATNKSSPVQIGTTTDIMLDYPYKLDSFSWNSIGAGPSSTMAVRSDGTLWAWGANPTGVLGLGDIVQRSFPTQVGANSNWTVVNMASGTAGATAGAITTETTNTNLYMWGINATGYQLGVGDPANRSSPVQVSSQLTQFLVGEYRSAPIQLTSTTWLDITTSESHATTGIRSDGTLWGWGYNVNNQVGDGTTIDRSSPVQIASGAWLSVAGGTNTSYAIREDYTLWSWGVSAYGEQGKNLPTAQYSVPTLFDNNLYKSVSANRYSMYALDMNNKLWACGYNNASKLNDGTSTNRSSPVQIGTDYRLFCGGAGASMSGAVFTLGASASIPQTPTLVASGVYAVASSSPVLVGANSWSKVSAGKYHSVALSTTNTVFTWGRNDFGQLGDSTTINRSSPVQLSTSMSDISAGYNYSMIKTTTQIYTFGDDSSGQLGGS